MENAGYLYAAFAIVWAVVFGYIFFLTRKQRRLEQEIGLLEQEISED